MPNGQPPAQVQPPPLGGGAPPGWHWETRIGTDGQPHQFLIRDTAGGGYVETTQAPTAATGGTDQRPALLGAIGSFLSQRRPTTLVPGDLSYGMNQATGLAPYQAG